MKNNSNLTDFNAKCTKFDFAPAGRTYSAPMTPSWCGGRLAAHPLIGATWHTMSWSSEIRSY